MTNWWRIAGMAAVLAAWGVQFAHSRLAIRKSEFLMASHKQIQAVEVSEPRPGEGIREQCLEASLAAERERNRLYAEQSFALNGYLIEQTELMMVCWACLFAAGLGLIVSSRRRNVPDVR